MLIRNLLVYSISKWVSIVHFFVPKRGVALAYKFFSEPREGSLKNQKIPDVLQCSEVKMIEWMTHSFPVYQWKHGHSESVMLVHGWESNSARWEPLIPFLAQKYNVSAIDAPAHGLASGKEFNTILFAQFILKAQEVFPSQYLIGHSMGGMACYYYAYQNPQTHIQKMLLLGAPSNLERLVLNYAKLLKLNPILLNQFEDFFEERFNYRFHEFSIQNFGPKINIDGMIVHDIDDDVVLFEEAQKIDKSWQQAFLHPTKGLGHSLQDEDLYKTILSFLHN